MLDPWVRVPLILKDAKTGKYQAEFYVIYKFNYKLGPSKIRNISI
jgi:hypothetical protein